MDYGIDIVGRFADSIFACFGIESTHHQFASGVILVVRKGKRGVIKRFHFIRDRRVFIKSSFVDTAYSLGFDPQGEAWGLLSDFARNAGTGPLPAGFGFMQDQQRVWRGIDSEIFSIPLGDISQTEKILAEILLKNEEQRNGQ